MTINSHPVLCQLRDALEVWQKDQDANVETFWQMAGKFRRERIDAARALVWHEEKFLVHGPMTEAETRVCGRLGWSGAPPIKDMPE